MIDYEGICLTVAKSLKDYCGVPVIQSNQNEEPSFDTYLSYTITTPMSENKGTYGVYKDGKDRKAFTQIWSISSISSDNLKSVANACKAREWLDHVGTTTLSDNGVIVQSVGSVTNRDNFLTVEYEYKNGFDVVFWLMDENEGAAERDEYIESVELGNINIAQPPTVEELTDMLEERLNGEVSKWRHLKKI